MPKFTQTGQRAYDLWLVDNSPHFSVLPANTIQEFSVDIPILLYVGTSAYGEVHIRNKHQHWINKIGLSVPELVFNKLGQQGNIYCTESKRKLKISLNIHPSALLILTLLESRTTHFSVTSLYLRTDSLDGTKIGRYYGRK